MRKIIVKSLILAGILLAQCGNGPKNVSGKTSLPSSDTGTAVIEFREYEHDFGKVAEGEKVGYTFTFENKGSGNLLITNATTTCGCTISKYNTRPISPGKEGSIEVVFDTTGRSGTQTKTVTVQTNASNPVILLKINAEVVTNTN